MDIKLYRKRFIPYEVVHLKNDIIEYIDEQRIVTRWKTIRPHNDFEGGRSCYFIKEGYKVSWFFDKDGRQLYTYCDIILTEYNKATNEYIFSDLLIDVVINPDGSVKVLDLGQIPDALDQGLITVELAKIALKSADRLTSIIYSGKLSELTKYLQWGYAPYPNATRE